MTSQWRVWGFYSSEEIKDSKPVFIKTQMDLICFNYSVLINSASFVEVDQFKDWLKIFKYYKMKSEMVNYCLATTNLILTACINVHISRDLFYYIKGYMCDMYLVSSQAWRECQISQCRVLPGRNGYWIPIRVLCRSSKCSSMLTYLYSLNVQIFFVYAFIHSIIHWQCHYSPGCPVTLTLYPWLASNS